MTRRTPARAPGPGAHARRRRRALERAATVAIALVAGAGPAVAFDDALYATLLSRHTREVSDTAGVRVDYLALRGDPDWQRVVEQLRTRRPAADAARGVRLAFWINAYNILAMQTVIDAWPVESIRDAGSLFRPVWKRSAGRIGDREVTLHEIEHEILRPLGEPRIHAAIICASVSCPPLRREPWRAAKLDAQFDDSVRRWLAMPDKGVRIDRAERTVHLSKIFDWFEEDFAVSGGVLSFVGRYRDASDRAWLAANGAVADIVYMDYDWSLNGL